MTDDKDREGKSGGGFLARGHHRLRFTELGEAFFGRVILAKCPDPNSPTAITVPLTLCDLFRRLTAEELVAALENETISEAPKISEIIGDFFNLQARGTTKPALDYYHDHMRTRLGWLKSGEPMDNLLPCIDDVTTQVNGKLTTFNITVRPAVLRERLGEQIPVRLDLAAKLIQQLNAAQRRPADPGPRIDYRKQVAMLIDHLAERQTTTGETVFSILSSQIPFRWALQHVTGTSLTMLGIGTSDVEDKILLPLFLEVNGFIDVIDIDLESDPRASHDVVVRYAVRKPATRNIFGASNAGLAAATRAQLNETELTLYHRLHEKVREGLVFGGKPQLESSFGMLGAWLIRKATYCLEEPSFLGEPARHWLKQHETDNTLQMEDQFFLPALYERLRNDFGSRVVKKPERFGGEIDILFDDTIPIELKVRRGRQKPFDVADVDEKFRPGGQAAVYAAISRLGFVVVLDLPNADTQMVNLENCATVIERRFPEEAAYPTCIVVVVLRCYERTPSSSR